MNFVPVKSFICNMKDKQKKTLKKVKKFIRNALLSNEFFNLLFIIKVIEIEGKLNLTFSIIL